MRNLSLFTVRFDAPEPDLCGHDLPVLDTSERKPIPGFHMEPICPFWTPGRENRFQGSKSSRFARSGHAGDNRFQGSKRNRFTDSGHGEKADSRIRSRTRFGWNLNYAADGISNLAHRPTTLFPTSSSSRIFVGEVGDPRASQSHLRGGGARLPVSCVGGICKSR
ncbi:unnamed protein product [Sphagnum compactum]